MASNQALSLPNSSKKGSSTAGRSGLTPAASLLSLRSVIDFMPGDIRLRYKDAAKFIVWPECPLDGNGQAADLNEEDDATTTNLTMGKKLKRNFTLGNEMSARAYSHFGNDPVMVPATAKPVRNRRTSDAGPSDYRSFTYERGTKTKPPPVAYFSSKDGDVSVRLLSAEMTRL